MRRVKMQMTEAAAEAVVGKKLKMKTHSESHCLMWEERRKRRKRRRWWW